MSRRRSILAALAAAWLITAGARAFHEPAGPVGPAGPDQSRDASQTPRTGSGVLSGLVVTDENTPQPIRRAQVTVTNADASLLRNTFTNDAGRFSITGLPSGRYTLAATKPAYLRSAYGAKRHDRPGTPITLADGHQMTDITLRMARGAVLGGTIRDENGQPASGVSVRVMQLRVQGGERTFVPVGVSGNPFGETTDDRGMYRFYGLPPGEYAISATPRFITGEVRAMTDAEIRAVMQALERRTAQQQAAQSQMSGTGITATPPMASAPPAPSAPDEDIVTVGYANVYYPGTTVAASASTVTVAAGEERSGVDFSLQLVRTAKIQGVISVPAGIRPQTVQLMLTPSASGGAMAASLETFTVNRAAPGPDGSFSFNAVPPGEYTIIARASAPGPGGQQPAQPGMPGMAGATMQFQAARVGGGGAEPMMIMTEGMGDSGSPYWGQTDISVAGTPLSGVSVSLQPGMTITGRVAFKSSRLVADPDLSRVRLTLAPAPTTGGGGARIMMGIPVAKVEANGQFTITGVTPGRYRISGVAPMPTGSGPGPGWSLQSAMVKGREVLDFPLDVAPNDEITDVVVTFSDTQQEVSGSLQDPSGRPAPDYTIIVFASDSRYWTSPTRRIRSTRPGTDGRFSVSGLPPGEYLMAAVADVAPTDVNDPAFLEQLVGASFKFTLAEGEKKSQDLRISGGL